MLGAISQGLGAIASGVGQAIANKKQRAYDTKMYEKQKQDRIDFWNMENMYNTPEAQMERFKKAGLNPNLIYGQFNNQTPQIQAPDAKVSDVSGNMSGFLQQLPGNMASMINQQYDLRVKNAQADQLHASAEQARSNIELNGSQILLNDLEREKRQTDNEYLKRTLEERIDQVRAGLQNTIANTSYTNQRTRTEGVMQNKLKTDMRISLDQNARQAQLQKWTIEQMRTNMAKTIAETAKVKAESNLIGINTNIAQKNTELLDYEYIKKDLDVGLKQWEYEFIMRNGYYPQNGGLDQVIKNVTDPFQTYRKREKYNYKPNFDHKYRSPFNKF